jgi:hypothetical protein
MLALRPVEDKQLSQISVAEWDNQTETDAQMYTYRDLGRAINLLMIRQANLLNSPCAHQKRCDMVLGGWKKIGGAPRD